MSTPTRSEFLERVAEIVIHRFPLVKLGRNMEEFELSLNGYRISLENLYRSTAGDPEHFEPIVERWVLELLRLAEGTPDQRASYEELKERIMPMVIAGGPRDLSSTMMVSEDFLEGLRIAYAVDSERSIAYISRPVFEKWNVSMDQLHDTAIQNLVSRSQTLAAQAAQDENERISLIVIQTRDGYDASRILLPGLHEHLREHLGSPFLAAIPNRDILLCFRDEPETVKRMSRQVAEDFGKMPHQVSPRLFLVTADGIAERGEEEAKEEG